jgi:hypothetical protein
MLYYARSLQFDDKPKYEYLQGLLDDVLQIYVPHCDLVLDWIPFCVRALCEYTGEG